MNTENLSGEFILEKKSAETIEEKKVHDNSATPPVKKLFHNDLHFYSSYSERPQGLRFESQYQNEEILLLIRAAQITNLPWIFVAILLIIAPPLLLPFLPFLPNLTLSVPIQTLIFAFYYLMISGFILVEFILWYFNAGFVTNTRIVDADIEGIIYKHVSEAKLDLIQDVSYTQIGAVRNLFNYGDIFIQTAGSLPNFEVLKAPRPAHIVHLIESLRVNKK
jgi:hypothetical protein